MEELHAGGEVEENLLVYRVDVVVDTLEQDGLAEQHDASICQAGERGAGRGGKLVGVVAVHGDVDGFEQKYGKL